MYCNVQDIADEIGEKLLAQLTDDVNGQIVVVPTVEHFIQIGTATINGYLRGRYKLPLEKEHIELRTACINIVKYLLFQRRGKMQESVKEAYDGAINLLQQIQSGAYLLDEQEAARPPFFLVSKRNGVYPY